MTGRDRGGSRRAQTRCCLGPISTETANIAGAAIRPGPSDLDTISEDLSAGGADITGYAIEQGRLAAARNRPNESDH
jgi:hypothetical protein